MNPVRNIFNRTSCCGIRELYGISDKSPELILYSLGYYLAQNETVNGSHYLFSDNTGGHDDHYGEILRDYILEQGLGTVVETPFTHNPNSGNMLKAFLWTINQEAFNVWYTTKVQELAVRGIMAYQASLSTVNLAIGDFVRCITGSPNSFTGRARIVAPRNQNIALVKQDGTNHDILVGEIGILVKTRAYPIN